MEGGGALRLMLGGAARMACDAQGACVAVTGNVRYTVKGAKIDGRELDDFNVYPGVPLPLKGGVVTIPGQPTCNGNR